MNYPLRKLMNIRDIHQSTTKYWCKFVWSKYSPYKSFMVWRILLNKISIEGQLKRIGCYFPSKYIFYKNNEKLLFTSFLIVYMFPSSGFGCHLFGTFIPTFIIGTTFRVFVAWSGLYSVCWWLMSKIFIYSMLFGY